MTRILILIPLRYGRYFPQKIRVATLRDPVSSDRGRGGDTRSVFPCHIIMVL